MKNNSNKVYKKALRYYEKGEINKALSLCEKEISKDISNREILNLKGLILYLRGDLKGSKYIWKVNHEANKDNIAKKYLESLSGDEERERQFLNALKLSNSNSIRQAYAMVEKCMDSDFNSINVNNLYASLCLKLMEYDKAVKSLEKILKIDKNNKEALLLRKEVGELGVTKKNKSNKVKLVIMSASVIIIMCGVSYEFIKRFNIFNSVPIVSKSDSNKDNSEKSDNETGHVDLKEESNSKDKESNNNPIEVNKNDEEKNSNENVVDFNSKEVKDKISNKDYKYINNIIKSYKNKDLKINDKIVLNSAIEFMDKEGLELAYKEASKLIKDKKFKEAAPLLHIAEEYSGNSYLKPHILYMSGFLRESTEDVENALKYYKEYVDKYKDGEYREEVLYRMALIYKGVDKSLSVKYAEALRGEFPNSMYNNSNIKNILD
ncbi:tetratricopeptide repeat protein [Clostridium hydrogeniformans]|uniref:tetratricopeptide repeat protein n=1 Tax=Clostridium hydrogeniformans TaxID=349933 RepID=UPI0004836C30|nr:CDC27 family protein [Clostridium hydrogeniformans]